MGDALRVALEWARDQGVSPWAVAWLAAGYLMLRGLAKAGAVLTRTASGAWTRYDEMFKSLETQLADARKELEQVKAERESLRRQLERSDAMVELQRAKTAMGYVPPHMRADEE